MSRLFYPAASRNSPHILARLEEVLPEDARILELASGSGEHGVYFCERHPSWTWQPSDPSDAARQSVDAWREHTGLSNLLPSFRLNAETGPWPTEQYDAVVCINMIHITPWSTTEGLFRGAPDVLRPGGLLITYGPYAIDGKHTAPSNQAFDESLRERDPFWGIRDIHALDALAKEHGFAHAERHPMPANNFTLVFKKISE